MLLVGDIGGTKTRLALYDLPLKVDSPVSEMTFKSIEFDNLSDLTYSFLKRIEVKRIETAVLAVAGPVIDGSVNVTNLPWRVVDSVLENDLNIGKVWIINDLEAIANSIPYLEKNDFLDILEGEYRESEVIAVIAPGTGLGEAYLTWDDGRYIPHATEGGHTDFGPTSKEQIDLLAYMLERFDHVSYERLCSGIGIPNIYSFLRSRANMDEPAWLAERLSQAQDPTPVIVEAARNKDPECRICKETIRFFSSILGAECGNLALKFKAAGGIYIGGGMIPKMIDVIDLDGFRRAYKGKGRFREFVARIPVRLINNTDTAIIGAAHYGARRLE